MISEGRRTLQRGRARSLIGLTAGLLILSAGLPGSEPAAPRVRRSFNGTPEQSRLILATATTGGTYYPVGVGIATLVSRRLREEAGISLTAITSAGSGENIQLLRHAEADLAIIQGLWAAMAWQGRGKYRSPQRHLRSLTVLWDNVEHFIILRKHASSGDISDMVNLRGKRFSIGKRGSGTEVSGREVLLGAGFDPDEDFKLQYLGYTPSAASLQNKRIAGMNIPAGPPAGAVTQAFAALGAKNLAILSFTDTQLAAINARYPVWHRFVIPAGTYPGQPEAVAAIAQPNLLIARDDLPEDTVFRILETIYDNLEDLRRIHRATEEMTLDKAVSGLSLPLHQGAVRFYRDRGLEIPSRLILKQP